VFAEPPPPPRRAPLLFGSFGARFAVIFFGMLLVGGLVTGASLAGCGYDDWLLDQRGRPAQGTAVDLRKTLVARSRTAHGPSYPVFDILVEFVDQGGRRRRAWVSTDDDYVIATARAHGRIEIDYDPDEPSRARCERSAAIFEWSVLPLGVAAIALLPVAVGLLRSRRSRRIYRDGVAAPAIVEDVRSTSSSDIGGRVMRVAYAFAVGGQRFEGVWRMARAPAQGARVWIVYDPRDPRRNVPSVS
jgi:hypothetical protein